MLRDEHGHLRVHRATPDDSPSKHVCRNIDMVNHGSIDRVHSSARRRAEWWAESAIEHRVDARAGVALLARGDLAMLTTSIIVRDQTP
jgi:hypothetical protein